MTEGKQFGTAAATRIDGPRIDSPGGPPNGPLIEPVALAAALESSTPPVLLDVRWSLAGTDHDAFRAGHVPGAVFVDLDAELTAPPGIGGRHPLPEPATLDSLLRRAGIDEATPVVVCGQRDASACARAWWLLRWAGHRDVRVLDGGFEGWRAAGLLVAVGDGAGPGGGTAVVRRGAMPTVDADTAAAFGAAAGSVLVDVRAPERYRGEVEPVDPIAGHIPGAVNLPLAAIHVADGRLADPDELRRAFAAVGVHDAVPAAVSCGSGVNACAAILAAEVIGLHLALYPGSYSGWCALGRAVETG